MTELYRLRSMDRLFGDSQELDKQTIYFASAEELNDPIEGFRDIFWQGDRIAWTNLFRNYLYCLHMTYIHLKIIGESTTLRSQDIPVMSDMIQSATPKEINLFEDICGKVFETTNLHDFIKKLVNINRKSRRDEILFYIQSLHFVALEQIQNAHIDHGLAPDDERLEKSSSIFKAVYKIPDLAHQIEDDRFLDLAFSVSSRTMEGTFIRHKYNLKLASESEFEGNRQLLIYDFPGAYLKQLERLLYPDWYVACFTRDYRNSSTWGNYGDNHKGVCLVFEAETTEERNSITLNRITGYSNNGELWRPSPVDLVEVKYGDKACEIDFFRSIGRLPKAKLMKVWYSDRDGNLSVCRTHLETHSESWRENYWNNFFPDITLKTQDWEYEQESRLLLYSLIGDLNERRCRTLTYNFSSLKGIIFGIRTPDSDKLKIIETVHKKCRENNRADFEFFQAYYCRETGDIQKYRLNLKFSV